MTPPIVFTEAADMRAFSREQRRMGRSVGFVPTMVKAKPTMLSDADMSDLYIKADKGNFSIQSLQGYLHEGHISLVLAAK